MAQEIIETIKVAFGTENNEEKQNKLTLWKQIKSNPYSLKELFDILRDPQSKPEVLVASKVCEAIYDFIRYQFARIANTEQIRDMTTQFFLSPGEILGKFNGYQANDLYQVFDVLGSAFAWFLIQVYPNEIWGQGKDGFDTYSEIYSKDDNIRRVFAIQIFKNLFKILSHPTPETEDTVAAIKRSIFTTQKADFIINALFFENNEDTVTFASVGYFLRFCPNFQIIGQFIETKSEYIQQNANQPNVLTFLSQLYIRLWDDEASQFIQSKLPLPAILQACLSNSEFSQPKIEFMGTVISFLYSLDQINDEFLQAYIPLFQMGNPKIVSSIIPYLVAYSSPTACTFLFESLKAYFSKPDNFAAFDINQAEPYFKGFQSLFVSDFMNTLKYLNENVIDALNKGADSTYLNVLAFCFNAAVSVDRTHQFKEMFNVFFGKIFESWPESITIPELIFSYHAINGALISGLTTSEQDIFILQKIVPIVAHGEIPPKIKEVFIGIFDKYINEVQKVDSTVQKCILPPEFHEIFLGTNTRAARSVVGKSIQQLDQLTGYMPRIFQNFEYSILSRVPLPDIKAFLPERIRDNFPTDDQNFSDALLALEVHGLIELVPNLFQSLSENFYPKSTAKLAEILSKTPSKETEELYKQLRGQALGIIFGNFKNFLPLIDLKHRESHSDAVLLASNFYKYLVTVYPILNPEQLGEVITNLFRIPLTLNWNFSFPGVEKVWVEAIKAASSLVAINNQMASSLVLPLMNCVMYDGFDAFSFSGYAIIYYMSSFHMKLQNPEPIPPAFQKFSGDDFIESYINHFRVNSENLKNPDAMQFVKSCYAKMSIRQKRSPWLTWANQ